MSEVGDSHQGFSLNTLYVNPIKTFRISSTRRKVPTADKRLPTARVTLELSLLHRTNDSDSTARFPWFRGSVVPCVGRPDMRHPISKEFV
jgi:hypothetical protein